MLLTTWLYLFTEQKNYIDNKNRISDLAQVCFYTVIVSIGLKIGIRSVGLHPKDCSSKEVDESMIFVVDTIILLLLPCHIFFIVKIMLPVFPKSR